jgi:hypothetical protein
MRLRWLLGAVAITGCALLVSLDDLGDHGDASGADVALESSCGDVQTSSSNCGRCGHDCRGGACSAGKCTPAWLAPLQPSSDADWIAVDGPFVYWLENSQVRRAPTTPDAGISTPVGGMVPKPQRLVAGAPDLFLVGQMTSGQFDIFHVREDEPPDGAAPALVTTVNANEVLSYAHDPTHDYLLIRNGTCGGSSALCFVASSDGGASAKVGSTFTADAATATFDGRLFFYADNNVESLAVGEAAGTVLAVDPGGFTSITADPSGVYLTAGSSVKRVARSGDGGPPAVVLSGQQSAQRAVVRDGLLVWVSGDGIVGCDPTSCTAATTYVSAANATVTSITLDAVAIYWIDVSRGGVYAVAR